jgi:hypothetical protein
MDARQLRITRVRGRFASHGSDLAIVAEALTVAGHKKCRVPDRGADEGIDFPCRSTLRPDHCALDAFLEDRPMQLQSMRVTWASKTAMSEGQRNERMTVVMVARIGVMGPVSGKMEVRRRGVCRGSRFHYPATGF